jgi:hypothetical protein
MKKIILFLLFWVQGFISALLAQDIFKTILAATMEINLNS